MNIYKNLNWLAIAFVALLVGCASNGSINKTAPELTYKQQPYVIGIGDVLLVDVWRNPELSRQAIVRPDGFITMPLMGDVRSEGRTPSELASVVGSALKKVIKNPEVTISVTQPVSTAYQFRVRAMGQVNQPVSIAYVEGMTVMDLVLAAGGVSPFGAANRSVLNRLTEQGYKEYSIRVNDILESGDVKTNYILQPGDLITIPEKKIWRGEF
ncbi:XrtA/PEP-CTERM system exopolysaccharide export protein [Reinekea sp.]|jgi:polysaccharide export outer membrane protein|uniref:XrtA/PEP-CTERM system exopolysaccharide export protein n=1 Tax=Reinekea sp. TaxID=1970455 RepID=UPI003989B920